MTFKDAPKRHALNSLSIPNHKSFASTYPLTKVEVLRSTIRTTDSWSNPDSDLQKSLEKKDATKVRGLSRQISTTVKKVEERAVKRHNKLIAKMKDYGWGDAHNGLIYPTFIDNGYKLFTTNFQVISPSFENSEEAIKDAKKLGLSKKDIWDNGRQWGTNRELNQTEMLALSRNIKKKYQKKGIKPNNKVKIDKLHDDIESRLKHLPFYTKEDFDDRGDTICMDYRDYDVMGARYGVEDDDDPEMDYAEMRKIFDQNFGDLIKKKIITVNADAHEKYWFSVCVNIIDPKYKRRV